MEAREEFMEAIAAGMDVTTASQLIGASPTNMYRLLERGKREQERLTATTRAVKPKESEATALELWTAVAQARAKGVRRLLENVRADDDWKASAYLLERMAPETYASGGSVREVEARPLGELEGNW